MGSPEQPRTTRREFLAGVVGGIVGLAVGAAVGSQAFPRKVTETVTETKTTTVTSTVTQPVTVTQTVRETVTPTPTFMIPPTPISLDEVKERIEVDVVVIGAGVSGAAAAASAAEEGASVIVVEKRETFSYRGGDFTGINTKIHEKLGIRLDPLEIAEAFWKWSGGRTNHRWLTKWAKTSGKVLNWVIDIVTQRGYNVWLVIPDRVDEYTAIIDKWPLPTGFPSWWDYRKERYVEYPTCHRFGEKPLSGLEGHSAMVVVESLLAYAQKKGAKVHYNTQAVQLVRQNGRVVGVIARRKEGDYVFYKASKGVIVATGDYGGDEEMKKTLLSDEYKNMMTLVPYNTGDGHKMVLWVGGLLEPTPHAAMVHIAHAMGTDAFLLVDRCGRRFMNEDADPTTLANQFIRVGGAWTILDSDWPNQVPYMGVGFFKIWRGDERDRREFEEKVKTGRGAAWFGKFVVANTLEELADKMKEVTPTLDKNTFLSTVRRYNELARRKFDEDFGKRSDRMFPVEKPPFYAGWTTPPAFFLVTVSGFMYDDKLRPLDTSYRPIEGVHITGNMMGMRFGVDYPLICPGTSHSMALTSGYLAGKYVLGLEA